MGIMRVSTACFVMGVSTAGSLPQSKRYGALFTVGERSIMTNDLMAH
jgi:hypothetical protein